MKIVDSCQTVLSLQEVYSSLDTDLYDKVMREDAESVPEWVRRKATCHKAVAEYIVNTLQPTDRTVTELSLIISALRSYDLSDDEVGQVMSLSRLTSVDNNYIDMIMRGKMETGDLDNIRKISSFLRPEAVFIEDDVRGLFKSVVSFVADPQATPDSKKIRS